MHRSHRLRSRTAIVLIVASTIFAACSSDSSDDESSDTSATTVAVSTTEPEPTTAETTAPDTAVPETTTPETTAPATTTPATTTPATTEAPAPPAKSAVDISAVTIEPMPNGAGVAQASATIERQTGIDEFTSLSADYTETEYAMTGVATVYVGDPTDTPQVDSEGNPYTTRLLVRRPTNPDDFSGRVMIEPFNNSGGADSDALYAQIAPLLEANGDAWIGVTHHAAAAVSLAEFDPERYAAINLPTNNYAWDILRQIGGITKEGAASSPLADLAVEHVYMGGYSQNGVDTAAFLSAFHSTTRMDDDSPVYDGYLPAAHAASLTTLKSDTAPLPPFEFAVKNPVDVPVVDIQTQSDVQGFEAEITPEFTYLNPGAASVRRDDSDDPTDLYRLYEVSGAPHVDGSPNCDGNGSSFPRTAFLRGATALLFAWAEDGVLPPHADRIDLEILDVVSKANVDEFGNAVGGVRSPQLDVPLATFAANSNPGAVCQLVGNQINLPADQLAGLYTDADTYIEEFTASLDAIIAEGFLLESDRAALIADAEELAAELLPEG